MVQENETPEVTPEGAAEAPTEAPAKEEAVAEAPASTEAAPVEAEAPVEAAPVEREHQRPRGGRGGRGPGGGRGRGGDRGHAEIRPADRDRRGAGVVALVGLVDRTQIVGNGDASCEDVIGHPEVIACLKRGLEAHNASSTGSSMRIARAMLT